MVGLVPSTSAVKRSPIPIPKALVKMSSLVTIKIPLDRYCGNYLAACSCLTWQWYPRFPKPS
eukprot:10615001-Heterocapsa_arctica.AAC.1